eukprot:113066_1
MRTTKTRSWTQAASIWLLNLPTINCIGCILVLLIIILSLLIAMLFMLYTFEATTLHELKVTVNVATLKSYHPINWSDPIESCEHTVLQKYQLDIPDWYIRYRPKHISHWYLHEDIPVRTWTYWLSNIESKNKLKQKAYFTDKYLVKQYIENMKTNNAEFIKNIHYAKVIYDFIGDIKPSFEELKTLKQKYGAFLVKPNNYCAIQIMVKKDDELTEKKYTQIIRVSDSWLHRNYTHEREDHYLYIKPHVFIEQHINVDGSHINNRKYSDKMHIDELVEYKIMVVHYKAVFMCVQKKPYKNCYSISDFKLLNVYYGFMFNETLQMKQPSSEVMDNMIQFSETFALKEKFKFVRVDLYAIRDMIYFSEFTFTPARTTAKITPVSFDYLLYDIVCNNSQENVDRIREFIY